MKLHVTIYLYYDIGELTFHECIIFGHPRGYYSVFTKAVDFGKHSYFLFTLMPESTE